MAAEYSCVDRVGARPEQREGSTVTRLRNGSKAKLDECVMPHSNLKESIAAILKTEGYVADHTTGADEQGFAPGPLHDPRMRRGRRVQYSQHLVAAMDQFL